MAIFTALAAIGSAIAATFTAASIASFSFESYSECNLENTK